MCPRDNAIHSCLLAFCMSNSKVRSLSQTRQPWILKRQPDLVVEGKGTVASCGYLGNTHRVWAICDEQEDRDTTGWLSRGCWERWGYKLDGPRCDSTEMRKRRVARVSTTCLCTQRADIRLKALAVLTLTLHHGGRHGSMTASLVRSLAELWV